MRTDTDIRQDVLDELVWEASLDAREIGVAVKDGMVTLTGHVPSFGERWTAENIAKHIMGVRGVSNEISVQLPSSSLRSDADIARAVLHALEWDIWVPQHRVTVAVSDGWIKLYGEVDTPQQKRAAERVIRTLTGVRGLTNLIRVTPKVQPADVKTKIIAAFQRSAQLDARGIQVEIHDGKVVLRGRVHAWYERETAEQAAWAAPGVTEVENHIVVQPATTCKDKLEAFLRDNYVVFESQQHRTAYTAQDVAASEHIQSRQMAKVVMLVADGSLAMLVLPADRRADLTKARAALGAHTLRFAEEHDFAYRFPDCELGAMPPFGNLYDVPVYADRTLADTQMIVFQAGTHQDTMKIRYADFARLVRPTPVDVARSPRIEVEHY